jgi:hypothetical protein
LANAVTRSSATKRDEPDLAAISELVAEDLPAPDAPP